MRKGFLLIGTIVLLAGPVLGGELDEPDLIATDEESEFIDEFAMLAEDAMIELAARHKQDIGMSPSAVTVFTRKDIEASGATSITDLMRLVPGMDVVIATPAFTAVTSRLYWVNENWSYLVLVDGRDATLELIGTPFWEVQPILLEDIERIEVIRGPGSSLYGANALAGVISITTRSVTEKTSAWARVSGGETGRLRTGVRASARVGDWAFSLSGGAERRGSFLGSHVESMKVYVLRSLVGKVATVSNPESMESIPLGYQIKPSFYRAKILNVYEDMLAVATELSKPGKPEKTVVKQFIPFARIKRVCLLKDDIHLHL